MTTLATTQGLPPMDPEAFERQAVALAQVLLALPAEYRVDVEANTTHHFAPGIYTRTMKAPAGSIIVGHKHVTEFLNIVEQGVIEVCSGGDTITLQAGDKVVSRPGIRKVGRAITDVVWTTIHANPTDERDVARLEAQLCDLESAKVIYYAELEMMGKLFGISTLNQPTDTQ